MLQYPHVPGSAHGSKQFSFCMRFKQVKFRWIWELSTQGSLHLKQLLGGNSPCCYSIKSTRTSCKQNIITYTSVLSACGRASSWEHAIGLLTETMVESLQPNLLSYSAAMSACVKAGQARRALSLLQQAETTLSAAWHCDVQCCDQCLWNESSMATSLASTPSDGAFAFGSDCYHLQCPWVVFWKVLLCL